MLNRAPVFTWDAIVIDAFGPARISNTGYGTHIAFALGADGKAFFEHALRALKAPAGESVVSHRPGGGAPWRGVGGGFTDAEVPFFESTQMGIALPRGWDR